jgi:hypothetical protein
LIAVVTFARPCRVRVATKLRGIRYVRRLKVVGHRGFAPALTSATFDASMTASGRVP